MKLRTLPWAGILLLLMPDPTYAAATDEFLAFPGITRQQTTLDDADTSYSPFVNLFYSADMGSERRFKLLAESIITSNTHEIQRLQLGWQFGAQQTVWIGRYHTPIGYWNTEFHHGQYLQTAITRPTLMNFEGANGVLPTHFTGLLYQAAQALDDGAALDYTLAVGETAKFENRLHPVDILDPAASDTELGAVFRLGYLPDAVGENQLGVSLARSTLNAEGIPGIEKIDQTVAGVYANWHWQDFRVITELMRLEHELQPADTRSGYTALYVQGERKLTDKVILFGRLETTEGANDDDFLQLLPRFTSERQAIGLRYEFKQWQALTFELAHREETAGSYGEFLLQWSAVLP